MFADSSLEGALGDEIKIFKNNIEIGVALNANQLSNEACFDDVEEDDMFKFVTAGNENVNLFSSGNLFTVALETKKSKGV